MNYVENTIAEGIATLQAVCHSRSKDAGWWVDIKTGQSLKDNPYFFSNKLLLIISEVIECMEGNRKSLMDDKLPHRSMEEVELADAVIRIMDLTGAYEMDLAGAIIEKMEYDKTREDHQIENRLKEGGKAY